MPLSDYLRKNNIMELINGSSGSGQTYIALSSTQPNGDGTGVTEPSGNGYQRCNTRYNNMSGTSSNVANFPSEPTLDNVSGKYSITNTKDIYFYEATGNWGQLTHFAIYSSLTGGQMLAYGALANSISPTAGTIPVIRAGDLTIVEQ